MKPGNRDFKKIGGANSGRCIVFSKLKTHLKDEKQLERIYRSFSD